MFPLLIKRNACINLFMFNVIVCHASYYYDLPWDKYERPLILIVGPRLPFGWNGRHERILRMSSKESKCPS